MPSAKLYTAQGTESGSVELEPKVFGVKPNPGVIEQAVVAHLANRRSAVAHTKTKGEVRGGGRKPWRQKGTGRARHGSIRSPQWKGGGVIFGPRSERVFTKKMNVKTRRAALRMVLSDKAANERISVLQGLELAEAKTKHMASFLKKFATVKNTMIVLPTSNADLVRAGRNIPGLDFVRADSLNVYDTLNHQQVLIFSDALPVITKIYAK